MIEPNAIIVVHGSNSQEAYGRLSFIAVSDGVIFGVTPSQLVDAEAKQAVFLEHQNRSIVDFAADAWMSDGLLTAFAVKSSSSVKNPIYAEKFQIFSDFVEDNFKVGSAVKFGSVDGIRGEIVSARYRPIPSNVPQAWHGKSFHIVETKGEELSGDSVGSLVCSEDGKAVGVVLGVNNRHAMVYRFDQFLFDNDLHPASDKDVNAHNETVQHETNLDVSASHLESVLTESNQTLASYGLKRTGSVHKLRLQFETLFESQGLHWRRDAVGTALSQSVLQSFLSVLALFSSGNGKESESLEKEGRSK